MEFQHPDDLSVLDPAPTQCLGRIVRAVHQGSVDGWHCWDGQSPESVNLGVQQLRAGLDVWLGTPEETAKSRVGYGYAWQVGEFVVELYFHSGLPPEGVDRPRANAVAQMGVSDRE